ncbi:MAG: carbohydrate kinase family protein [Candidatus Kerfeldbacteria bacterium]|nr:carbohydrate kinase family protein [Candidatus Kerfeldbacteria bacterium]
MSVYVSGSLAFDRIMDFDGYYKDQILPEKIHTLSVSFLIQSVKESFGGTAGNIAYNLSLLGVPSKLLSQAGKDFAEYHRWLESKGIDLTAVHVFESDLTASAYIMTDKADNQIAAFHPGAMKYRSTMPENEEFNPETSLAIVSPGNPEDMMEYRRVFAANGVRVIADPGQQIPRFSKSELEEFLRSPYLAIFNDYEYDSVLKKLEWSAEALLNMCRAIIVTKGETGSVVMTSEGTTAIPVSPPNEVTDPTGAGDAYRAGLMKGILQGWDLVASARLGSVVASFAVEQNGTQVHTFTQEDIEKRYDALGT